MNFPDGIILKRVGESSTYNAYVLSLDGEDIFMGKTTVNVESLSFSSGPVSDIDIYNRHNAEMSLSFISFLSCRVDSVPDSGEDGEVCEIFNILEDGVDDRFLEKFFNL